MDIYKNYPQLEEDLRGVQQLMLDSISSVHGDVRERIESMITKGGKRLRPAFVLLGAYQGKRYNRTEAIAIGAALELLHLATLVHDDVIDQAHTRRGQTTLHTGQGNRVAILAGDLLFSSSFQLVAQYGKGDQGLYLAQGVRRVCESELRQSQTAYSLDITKREYLRRILGKTAMLFMLALHAGGHTGKVSLRNRAHLRAIGYNTGMAFQIIDDILDITESSVAVGKTTCNDLKQGIVTLPVILQIEQDAGVRKSIIQGWEKMEDSSVWTTLHSSMEYGVSQARKIACTYTQRALREVEKLPNPTYRKTLKELIELLLVRSY